MQEEKLDMLRDIIHLHMLLVDMLKVETLQYLKFLHTDMLRDIRQKYLMNIHMQKARRLK